MENFSKQDMQVYELEEFFQLVKYNFEEDLEDIKEICKLTKTRPKEVPKEFFMDYGAEQPFLLKSLINKLKSESFFEVGTGRGTGSYSVALEKSINFIATLDIIPHFFRQDTAIEFKPIKISQKGIHNLITFKEKNKIKFFHNIQKPYLRIFYKNKFDVAFIDGNHTDRRIINSDINLSLRLLKKNGVLIFDDYEKDIGESRKFLVGSVVDEFLAQNKYYSYLIEFRGHLFDKSNKEKNAGVLVVSPFELFKQ